MRGYEAPRLGEVGELAGFLAGHIEACVANLVSLFGIED